MRWPVRIARTAAVLFLMIMPAPLLRAAGPEYRMLWVDIFHEGLRTRDEVDTMLATARAANYNAVIVQMRKACDAWYNSGVEPRNKSLRGDFDPLAYILRQARDPSLGRPLEVHVWLVAYRCRMPSDETWKDPAHITQRQPGWLNQTFDGQKEDRKSGGQQGRQYLDPGVPGVIDYNLEVVRDLLSRYDVDGIHFDYIRYPETTGKGNFWGYNPVSVERFNRLYGREGKPAVDDPQWSEFRRMQITFMMRKVTAHVRAWRPRVKVSAALITWGGLEHGFAASSAHSQVFQDWESMARDGFLDLLIPMNYKRESVAAQAKGHRDWAEFLGRTAAASGRFGVNGVDGEELNSLPDIIAQVRATRSLPGISGIATYCYAQTRKGSKRIPDTEFFKGIESSVFARPAEIPQAEWLTRPRTGLIKGIVTRGRDRLDGARVAYGNVSAIVDGTGFYALANVPPGTVELVVTEGATVVARKMVEVRAGQVTEAPITAEIAAPGGAPLMNARGEGM